MIRFESVSFGYRRGQKVVEGVSFGADDGAVTVLAGPNASGKTTLLRLAVGLYRPDEGAVLVDGRDVVRLGGGRGRRVAAVMGEERPEGVYVEQYVLWGAIAGSGVLFEGRREMEAAERALKALGVSHLSGRPLKALSSGEWQRVQVARALAQQAKNIILDEPTAHLDVVHKLRLLQTLRQLAATERCILLVLHDIGLACRFADTIVVLHRGKVAAAGPPADVITPQIMRSVWSVEAEIVRKNGGIDVFVKTALEDVP